MPYSKHIDADRAEFGLENFTVEILAEADCLEDAHELEQRFIADYNSLWPNGYNISTGGYSNSGVKHSDETRKKMSETRKGKLLNREDQSKTVHQYTKDGELVKIWPSTAECGRNGFDQGHVASCCNGKLKTYKNYIFHPSIVLQNVGNTNYMNIIIQCLSNIRNITIYYLENLLKIDYNKENYLRQKNVTTSINSIPRPRKYRKRIPPIPINKINESDNNSFYFEENEII